MPKYLFALMAALCTGLTSLSQIRYNPQPADEQDVCFLYAEFGLPNNNDLKIVVFTTFIYRYPYDYGYGHPAMGSNSVRTMLTNAFHEKATRITRDEHNTSATVNANQVHLKSNIKTEWAFKTSATASGTGPDLYQTVSSATTFNLNVRNRVLSDYRAKGYKIYQTTLDEFYNNEMAALRLEEIHALSPLEYEVYQPGAMRALARRYQENSPNSGGGGGYLTIEDSNNSSSGTKQGNKSNTGSTSKTPTDPEYWKRQAEISRMQAEALEAEGDRLYKMGTIFYMQALQKYQQAQRLYPTPRVQERVNEINAYAALGQALNELGKSIDKGVENMDPDKKTRRMFAFFNYNGLMGSYNKIKNPGEQNPMGAFFALSGHRVLISFEVRFGYMVSPVYEYEIETLQSGGNRYMLYEKVKIQESSVGIGISGGMNLPLGKLVLYGLYGLDMMATVNNKIITPGYSLDENPTYPIFNTKTTLGASYNIPRSRLSFGVNYNFNKIKGVKDGSSPIVYDKNPDGHYYLNNTTDDIYRFGNLGVSIGWTMK